MMTTHIDLVIDRLEQQGTAYPLEEIIDLCPELTWNQVFLAIDHLSRTGQVRVTRDVGRSYMVQTCHSIDAVEKTAA